MYIDKSKFLNNDTFVKVKVSCGSNLNWEIFKRQAPKRNPIWNNTEFIFSNELCAYDYWVVLHNESIKTKEEAYCNPNNVIYISMEPTEKVGSVPNEFLNQFAYLVLTDPDIKLKNVIRENIHSWWVGIGVENTKKGHQFKSINLDYDALSNLKIPEIKKNRISILHSSKLMLDGHIKRNEFINRLLNSPLRPYIDIYGDGYMPVIDKIDIILPYKYHICIENSNVPNYWSEKLADAFLGYSLPIYYGNSTIVNYFSKDSMILIDIEDPDKSIDLIYKSIQKNAWETKIEKVTESRKKILNEYNILNFISKICNTKNNYPQSKISLYPAYYFRLNFIKRTLKLFYYYLRSN